MAAVNLRDDDNHDLGSREGSPEGIGAAGALPSLTAGATAAQPDQSWLLPMLYQAQEMVWSAHLAIASPTPPAREDVTGDTCPAVPPCPVLDEPEMPFEGVERDPGQDLGVDGDDGDSGTNPHAFLPPPPDAIVTMALVEWTNTATGETWTAPSGGFQPPNQDWVRADSASLAPDRTGEVEILPSPNEETGAEETRLPEQWTTWTSVTDTITRTDETGSVVGYEIVTQSSDELGNWTRSTQSYTADWRAVASSYLDNSGFGYAFKTLWSDDGVELGYVHHYSGAGNTYAIEVNYGADWRILSSRYTDPASGYESVSEFWYDAEGVMIGGTSTQFWTDENGPQSLTDNWWVNEPSAAEDDSLGVDESFEQSVEPMPGDLDTGDGSEAVPETAEPAPESEELPDGEVIPEIIICPGVIEIPPTTEGLWEENTEGLWQENTESPSDRVDPVPEPTICAWEPAPEISICPWEPAPDSLHEVAWEEVQWDILTPDPEAPEPEFCVLPPPFAEPPVVDPSWLRPALIDFEPIPLVGTLPDPTFT